MLPKVLIYKTVAHSTTLGVQRFPKSLGAT